MKQFKNKVAVITGAASGIGFAIAEQAAGRGMHVVIADIEERALRIAEEKLGTISKGGRIMALKIDVTDPKQMASLAERCLKEFSAVHLLVNNAGVGGVAGNIWETDLSDWRWVMNVNLWGVIHGLHVFSRIMQRQNEGHIVNTASVAGLIAASGMAGYVASKHAVVAISEAVYNEFCSAGINVGVSVLCPSYINTNIGSSERNRPDAVAKEELSDEELKKEAELKAYAKKFFAETAMAASAVAEQVFEAVEKRSFYILTHPQGTKEKLKERLSSIINDQPPPLLSAADFPSQ
ncbi:SDR family NAD(P)-dependent oxidoreductase [Parahaliea sp. F7430]|uniref:SDR family NAD(P)-dependent oxidoreductase n=1 Tax=Sediminihaliea albiluteola TaxID=2758564 RepID=A0A7W2TXI4_9GAMM|nr:SDR family NAD(P)-dependent oxidoreductase [Sediminihaliea albiluteola]MBA6413784.1 SDR family NAD(P)-dependent oxidoreductase [Sediminihaliea albiluteola]